MISYAQNFEDVMLWRALGHVANGFYIDLGAHDPIKDSVSRAFYENGWRGIHVEPMPFYANLLRENRPDETIFQTAIGTGEGQMKFFEIPETGISTGDPAIATQHEKRGFPVHEITVSCMTLAAVFKTCAGKDIHWLKIDVEGMEAQVLRSWTPSAARPWIVVVESTSPLTQIEAYRKWEPLVLRKGYTFSYFDGLNRFYVSNKHPELKRAFSSGPNVFDGFSLSGTASASFHAVLHNKIAALEARVAETTHAGEAALAAQEQSFAAASAKRNQDFQVRLATLEAAAVTHARELATREREFATQNSAREQAHRDEIAAAQEVLATKEREHETENTEREQAHRNVIAAARKELAAREREFSVKADAQEQAHRNEIAAARQEMATRERDFAAQAATQEQAHRNEIAAAQRELAVLQSTLSWRLTGPFRDLHRRFGGHGAPTDTPRSYSTNAYSDIPKNAPKPSADTPRDSPTRASHAQNLDELLSLDGEPFIECAYFTLLKRLPDASGRNFYLGRLFRGVAKMQILDEIASSDEARRTGASFPGLHGVLAGCRRAWRLFRSLSVDLFSAAEGNSAAEVRLRSLQQHLLHLVRQSEAMRAAIAAANGALTKPPGRGDSPDAPLAADARSILSPQPPLDPTSASDVIAQLSSSVNQSLEARQLAARGDGNKRASNAV